MSDSCLTNIEPPKDFGISQILRKFPGGVLHKRIDPLQSPKEDCSCPDLDSTSIVYL